MDFDGCFGLAALLVGGVGEQARYFHTKYIRAICEVWRIPQRSPVLESGPCRPKLFGQTPILPVSRVEEGVVEKRSKEEGSGLDDGFC